MKRLVIFLLILNVCLLVYIGLRKFTPFFDIIPSSKITQSSNKFVTPKTKIATSLEIPTLYSQAQWKEVNGNTQDDSLHSAEVVETGASVPFPKGHFWQTSLDGNSSSEIETYYQNELIKEGWEGSLIFKAFTLAGIDAGGRCGGQVGYLGYKEGMVRLVSILHNMSPCNPAPIPFPARYSLEYTLFISDPLPVGQIAKNIQTH